MAEIDFSHPIIVSARHFPPATSHCFELQVSPAFLTVVNQMTELMVKIGQTMQLISLLDQITIPQLLLHNTRNVSCACGGVMYLHLR